MNKACIVIPVYKKNPNSWEKASFKQALKVLVRYDFIIYTYKELDLSIYVEEATKCNKNFRVEFFDKSYFSSVKGYNKLCLNVDFYKRVSYYDFMLIYQLDAWVFRDELEDWCNKGYDYIGAPYPPAFGPEKWVVGNGGFSLRRISFHIKLLSYRYPLSCYLDFKNGFKGFMKSFLKSLGVHNTVSWWVNNRSDEINEDWLISNLFGKISTKEVFHPFMPLVEEAAEFSLEFSPKYFYELCGNRLPFGCHGFLKHGYNEFWKEFITNIGV